MTAKEHQTRRELMLKLEQRAFYYGEDIKNSYNYYLRRKRLKRRLAWACLGLAASLQVSSCAALFYGVVSLPLEIVSGVSVIFGIWGWFHLNTR